VDLYLAGHTHDGQIRLPLYGALVTSSVYGRRYASGLFREGDTTMYVSRGIGFEGGGLPRARFLCRPEVVSVDLVGK
jgi:predicted MPP superfamily phosphohydrolase